MLICDYTNNHLVICSFFMWKSCVSEKRHVPAQGHIENLMAKEPADGWVSHPPVCLLLPVSSHKSLPLCQACWLAYSLGCVDKVSNQLGVGSVRSGAGRGSAGEGHRGR